MFFQNSISGIRSLLISFRPEIVFSESLKMQLITLQSAYLKKKKKIENNLITFCEH